VGELENVGLSERVYPVYKIVPLTTHLEFLGVSKADALAGSGISVAALEDPYALISRRQVVTIFENFLRLAPHPVNALQLGAAFQLTDYGFYGYALLSSATVRSAVEFALTYRELATPIVALNLVESEDEAAWIIASFPENSADAAVQRFVVEYQSGIVLALHKCVSGNAFKFRSVQFSYPAPAGAWHYHAVFGCPITFDAPTTELRFEAAWLERSPLGANPLTYQVVEKACREMLERIGSARGTIGEISRRLLLQTGRFAKLDEMADQLSLHPRTLRRNIHNEGSTYQTILDEVRFKLAVTYLTQTGMTHEAIAERLGFSDTSSFRRAFKRWAKQSPNSFRSN
jgi:AraC-like DNA-binding protein